LKVDEVDWTLDLSYREKTFSGRVAIRFDTDDRHLTVDLAHLTVDSTTLDGAPTRYRENTKAGTLEFDVEPNRPHTLEVVYRGKVATGTLVGLYVAPAGPDYVLTSMFFPTGSRRVLPSFESPSVKAVYRLVLTVDSGVKVVFNTPPKETRTVDGRTRITFEPTPPMSAYLLYLGVGPFDTVTVPGPPVSVTVAASPTRASSGEFSARRTREIVGAYERYFGVPYPLSKLDLVALQNFWAGAMENWGAIAFRESLVLADASTTAEERQRILATLAHEIAHQWFGNLVTPSWWDDFWLNESFATFVGQRIIERRYPEENPWSYFVNRNLIWALSEDSHTATHPVKVPIRSAGELNEITDDVTYGKGASVLRMVEAYVGEEPFRRGVSRYLERYRFANARAQDLWRSIAELSEKPVERVMSEWITRPGYPVLNVTLAGRTLTVRQERFWCDGRSSPETWPVPLRVTSNEDEITVLFDQPEWTHPLQSVERLRIDPGRNVFARIRYDDEIFERLVGDFSALGPIDQACLVDDYRAFAYAGLVPVDACFRLVSAGQSLRDELPVRSIITTLGTLSLSLHDDRRFQEVASGFLHRQLDLVGLDRVPGEPDASGLLRELLAIQLAQMDPGFARNLAPRFSHFDEQIPELRLPVALSYAATGGETAFDELVDRIRATSVDAERARFCRALGAAPRPETVRRALDLIPSPGITPSGGWIIALQACDNPYGGGQLFEWFEDRFDSVTTMWAGTPLVDTLLRFGLPVMGMDREARVREFFQHHVPAEAARGVAQGLESLAIAQRLRERTRSSGNG
jgi:tricorn protease interacting factor F2/3